MPLKNLLHASFLVILKCHKHGQIGTARIQRRQGVGNPWKTTSSIGFYKKNAIWPHHLGKGWTP